MTESGATAEIGGFVDHHAHVLAAAAGIPFPWEGTTVREFHERVARDGMTPMDVPEPEPPGGLAGRLLGGLDVAARAGLVEVTEMGMRQWAYLDALAAIQSARPLPARVRIYLASGLAEQTSTAELDARRTDAGPWTRLEGIKFYADGWLVPRTCALHGDFADEPSDGILFASAPALARRIEPFAGRGWRIATHAIGDRAVAAVLDAYELAWSGDRRAIAAAAPRIEHGSVVSAELAARIATLGVGVCLQPSFAVSDAGHVEAALGKGRAHLAYPWAMLIAAGARLLLGTDYPIEVLDPLAGLARLVNGRSGRDGFATDHAAPEPSRLPGKVAFSLACDPAAGRTFLSGDPLRAGADLDRIGVLGTAPVPF